jgi:hypothetical protein
VARYVTVEHAPPPCGTADFELVDGTAGSDVIVGRGGIDWLDAEGGAGVDGAKTCDTGQL